MASVETGGSHLGVPTEAGGQAGQSVVSNGIGHHLFLSGFIPLSPLVISLFIFIATIIFFTIIIFCFFSIIDLFLSQPMG